METPANKSDYFLYILQSLRENEMIALDGDFISVKKRNEKVVDYLRMQFEQEQKEYPLGTFVFDELAAYWAAKLIFYSSQLMLNRESDIDEITKNIVDYDQPVNLNRSLSADLSLRFLPTIIEQLKEIDIDDPLIEMLDNIIHRWHYSGISFMKEVERLDFQSLIEDKLLLQMYAERVVYLDNKILMKQELVSDFLSKELGNYKDVLTR